MKIKSGRREYELTSKDRILDNGSCYILITQEISNGFEHRIPTLTKSTIKKLIKDGKLVLSKNKYKAFYDTTYDMYQIADDSE